MLLRSSSTPILGSLLSTTTASSSTYSSFHHDSPNHHYHQKALERTNSLSSTVDCPEHVSFSSPTHHHNPAPTIAVHFFSGGGFRRTSSDGNIEYLATVADHTAEIRWGGSPSPIRHGAPRPRNYLESAPSLSVYGPLVNDPGEDEDREEERSDFEKENVLDRSVTIADGIGEEFCFSEKAHALGVGFDMGEDEVAGTAFFLALGPGINANDPSSAFVNIDGGGIDSRSGARGGGGSGFHVFTDSGGDRTDLEMFYKKMVEENPSDALFLRNYAQFLYQVKHDLQKAEEYYFRAILAEPGDGETLSRYARLIWDLHHDHSRASSYFEQSVQAAPQDSYVLASYANFLWETEDGGIESFDETPMPVGAIA